MKSKVFYILGLCLPGCNNLLPEEFKSLPLASDIVVVEKTRYISNTQTQVLFESDLHLLHGFGDFEGPIKESFLVFPSDGQYEVENVTKTTVAPSSNSSVVILMDQSGSYELDDPFNNRTKAINRFCQFFQPPSDFMVGGFSSRESDKEGSVRFLQDQFTTDIQPQLMDLFSLAKETSGSSTLITSLDESIDRLSSAVNPVRHIVALVHSSDNSNAASGNSVINKAVVNNVYIDILNLGNRTDSTSLSNISQRTGGIFANCSNEKQLTTIYNALYYLIHYEHEVYRIRIKYVPASGTVTNGMEFNPSIIIHDQEKNIDYHTVILSVKIPE